MSLQEAKDARKAAYVKADKLFTDRIASADKIFDLAIAEAEAEYAYAAKVLHARKKEAEFKVRARQIAADDQYKHAIHEADCAYIDAEYAAFAAEDAKLAGDRIRAKYVWLNLPG